jgi:hypothetical protein
MIAPWPPKPRYKTKRLREAINTAAQTNALTDFMASTYVSSREASARLQEMRDTVTKAVTDIDALLAGLDTYSRTAKQARDIRDDLAAVIDESGRP